jgi:glycerophosphoryl diester phosphodiesterase
VIPLERRDGLPLRIGHRGAAALAPENTLASFRAALAVGVDLVEFDVLRLHDGELVVAHSNDLREASHGRHRGTVRDKPFAELRELCPDLPTLGEALQFFVGEAPDIGVHVDLKTPGGEGRVVRALHEHELAGRSLVSSVFLRTARRVADGGGGVRAGITFPRGVLGITETNRGAPVARVGLRSLKRVMPSVVRSLLSSTGASALVLHHRLVGRDVVRRAHGLGSPIVAWTVDEPAELLRLSEAGVDAVVTNDPGIFVSTLKA